MAEIIPTLLLSASLGRSTSHTLHLHTLLFLRHTKNYNMAAIDPLLEQIMAVLSCNRSVLDIDYGEAAVKVGRTGAHAAGNT